MHDALMIFSIPAAAVPERRRSIYFAIRELQRHHIDVAQRVWNFATSFTLFEWLNRGDRRCVCFARVPQSCEHAFAALAPIVSNHYSYQSLGVIHSLVCAGADVLLADMTLPWSRHTCSVRSKASPQVPLPV